MNASTLKSKILEILIDASSDTTVGMSLRVKAESTIVFGLSSSLYRDMETSLDFLKTGEVRFTEIWRLLPNLIANVSRHRLISEAFMDGAYDSIKSYRLLKRAGIKPIIKPRRNARTDRGPPERRNSAIMFKELGEKEWSRLMGYGRRWSAEAAFSTFKRLYGEYCMSKNMENITKELAAKAYIYNMLINLEN